MNIIDPFEPVNDSLADHDMGFDNSTVDEASSTKVAKWFDKQEKIMKKKKGCKRCDDEKVDHPAHYNTGKIEVIDAIEGWDLNFNCGNAVKYIARHRHKGEAVEDIEKALWYLNRHLIYLKEKERHAKK
jgi:hypothetical protein